MVISAIKNYIVNQEEEELSSVLEALMALPIDKQNIHGFEVAMDTVYLEMRKIMTSKQKLRGPGNIDNQGLLGVVTRMRDDKLERIMKSVKSQATRDTLINDGVPLEFVNKYYPLLDVSEGHAEDTLEDDLLDVANYSIICLMVLRGIWGLPTQETSF